MQFAPPAAAAAHPHLAVPAEFRARYDAAIAAGRQLGERLAAAAPADPAAFERYIRQQVAGSIGAPPVAKNAGELAELHAAEATHTPEGNSAAEWYARFASTIFEAPSKTLLEGMPAADARRAAALLQLAETVTSDVTDAAKLLHDRRRPYEVDPTLHPTVHLPRHNSSWPSGHSSDAAVKGALLADALPAEAAALLGDAAEVAWSRVYGGVHFPSDVLEGARIGAAVAAAIAPRLPH